MNKARPRKPQPKVAQGKQQAQSKKKSIWRRPAVWLGATSTAVLVGLLVNVLSTQAQRVVPSPDPATSTPEVRALVKLVPASTNGVIPKPISAISAPPSYPPSQSDDHCAGWWKKWFGLQEAAAVDGPLVRISAPQGADATVVSASIQVYGSNKPPDFSYIACAHGAGLAPGTHLYVNLDRPNDYPKIVSDAGQLTPLEMPGAVINIDPGHTEYISVLPTGRRGILYSWSVQFTVIINQRQEEFTFGSQKNPMRTWFGPIPPNAYDYSLQARSWQPFLAVR
jgi:hypothetical protein